MVGGTYKRPAGAAPLMSIGIGGKAYDDPTYQATLARADIAIVAFYPGWKGDRDGTLIRRATQQMKARNPRLKIAQYTILGEAQSRPDGADADKVAKLDQMSWWLKTAEGAKTQWTTAYGAYDINVSDWSRPDVNGDRYPQWLAKRDYQQYFARVPEFDYWYFDTVMRHSRAGAANWRLDGHNVAGNDPTVASAYRRAHAAHWKAAAALAPNTTLIGNVDNDMSMPEYRQQLPAALLEGMIGKSWSLDNCCGWSRMMKHYFDTAANLKQPAVIGFNVFLSPTDYRTFRYAFASTLLGNGHFAPTDPAKGFSAVPWFDEYEAQFGTPIDPPTMSEWSNGVVRRRYEHAMVLVNPQATPRTVTIEPGWRRLLARQDPVVNNGQPVGQLTLPAKDGIVLVRQ